MTTKEIRRKVDSGGIEYGSEQLQDFQGRDRVAELKDRRTDICSRKADSQLARPFNMTA